MRWGLCVVAAWLCAACYDPNVPVGLKCAASGTQCPSGQMCGIDQLCHATGGSDGGGIDAALDGGPTVDAGPAFNAGTVLVAELGSPVGNVAAVLAYWVPVAQQRVGLKTGDPSNLIGCYGYSFDQMVAGDHFAPASGNAGTISITGHIASGAACGPDGGPVSGCAPSPIVCNRDAMGVYSCPGTALPLVDFLPDDGTAQLHVVTTGGTDVEAFDTMVQTAALTRLDAMVTDHIVNAQRWDGTEGLSVSFASADANATGTTVRIEMSDGTITTSPFTEAAASRRYAILQCNFLGSGTVAVTAADIGATFQDVLPYATGVRIIIAKGRLDSVQPGASGVATSVVSAQGNILFDTMPRSP